MPAKLNSIDEAWSHWVAGRETEAMRLCVGILQSDPEQHTAAALLATMLAEGKSGDKRSAAHLVERFIDRVDLPRAVALAKAAGEGLDRVAAAFGAGSERVTEEASGAAPPPPLPPAELKPVTLKGKKLRALASKVLRSSAAAASEPSRPLPKLPLFGALEPEALERLLEAFEVRSVAAGTHVLEEGADGIEAFVVVRGRLHAVRGQDEQRAVLAELGPGAIFGEMALVSGAPRAASVVALEPCQLLVGSVKALEAASKRSPVVGRELSAFCRARMIENLLRHSRILGAVDRGERAALMQRFEAKTFSRGDVLVERGSETPGLFLIASGLVRVTGVDDDGDELVVAELGPGDVVGEIGLVLRRPASATVVATHHTVALELTREHFQEAIKQHPELLGELYGLATKREDELRSVIAQETLDVEDVVLL